jgi:hypothetical protein
MGSLILVSCRKGADLPDASLKYENLRKLPTASAMRTAFEQLSSIEKSEFLRYWIKKSMSLLDPTQRTLVSEIYQKISPAVYDKNSNDHLVFTTLTVPAWLKQAEPVLSKDKIREMFYFLEGETVVYQHPEQANRLNQVLPKW